MKLGSSLLFLALVCAVRGQDLQETLNAEGRLYRDLLDPKKQEPVVRPTLNATHVGFSLMLVSLLGIDEERQTLEIHAWVKKTWVDERLKWTKDDYSGVAHMRIPHDKIWKPDIVLFNGAFEAGEPSGFGHLYDALAVVYDSGYVLWIPPARIKSICLLDISNFPFDTQECSLKFGSWTYSTDEVYLDFADGVNDIVADHYTKSNVWELKKTWAERNDKKYDCCNETYADLTFYMRIARRRSYYSYMLVLPAIVMALLVPLVFLMPIGRPEKFHMGCTLLICLTLMTLLMEFMVPTAHSGVPFIEAYYLGNFILTGLSLAISAGILNISRSRTRPPGFVRKAVDMCAKCCCMSTDGASYRNYKVAMNSGQDENPIVMDVDGTAAPGPGASEWVVVATVLDRFFFVVSLIFAVLLTIGMASHT